MNCFFHHPLSPWRTFQAVFQLAMESSGIGGFTCDGELDSSDKPELDGADDLPAWSISCSDLRAAKDTWKRITIITITISSHTSQLSKMLSLELVENEQQAGFQSDSPHCFSRGQQCGWSQAGVPMPEESLPGPAGSFAWCWTLVQRLIKSAPRKSQIFRFLLSIISISLATTRWGRGHQRGPPGKWINRVDKYKGESKDN